MKIWAIRNRAVMSNLCIQNPHKTLVFNSQLCVHSTFGAAVNLLPLIHKAEAEESYCKKKW